MEKGVGVGYFEKKPVVGETAGRSLYGLHDEDVEEEKGGKI